jgi:diadenosine tetraphosphate (Ap4A) HIT family hydrolase
MRRWLNPICDVSFLVLLQQSVFVSSLRLFPSLPLVSKYSTTSSSMSANTLQCCNGADSSTKTEKGVTYDGRGRVSSCIFCRIIEKKEPASIVYEDSMFVVFKTIAPASNRHLLVCPREHIQNALSLSGPSGASLVRALVETGRVALGDDDARDAQFSFHIPPWNSIDHLHLHAIAQPGTKNWLGMLKYYEGSYWCKSAESLIWELENTMDRPSPSPSPAKATRTQGKGTGEGEGMGQSDGMLESGRIQQSTMSRL